MNQKHDVIKQKNKEVLVVIPARYGSTRFPGKMLANLCGYPLVYYAYRQAKKATCATEVLVATDDKRIKEALEPLGVPVVMTRADHASGTDRIAEVAEKRTEGIIVNVQGDEPLLPPECIDATVQPLLQNDNIQMSTACRPLNDPEQIQNPNVVKVVCDKNQLALYFSRSPIPYIRDAEQQQNLDGIYWQHIGLYVYRREFLLHISKYPQTPLEKLEKLEQLRVLEHGYSIAVIPTDYEAVGVDTPEDLIRVEQILKVREKEL
ncbi:MAG TPA: 3-deoxy-manno-octulosonate cytidylyltransferase [Candidatus Hydrogenedens sp.]|nr:3-deoxy-manno-octulosonate cytidylyltransferase [Candidatus Hydrogenedens sp.]HOL19850.1 3-deoxy-manno-octulosonate cytidylyltransferase [Candidatus Hydrogenedens sp.]HPP59567.1 3-deoxy-manno-octulosonate cytidylyltransferase [Candidatus Hydrogenedens sp.]